MTSAARASSSGIGGNWTRERSTGRPSTRQSTRETWMRASSPQGRMKEGSGSAMTVRALRGQGGGAEVAAAGREALPLEPGIGAVGDGMEDGDVLQLPHAGGQGEAQGQRLA